MKGVPVADLLEQLTVSPDPLTSTIVGGVEASQSQLDHLLSRYLRSNWQLDRLAIVDRLTLRIGAWELLHGDAPLAVVLSEAVELAKRYGGEESSRFINGVLGAVARDR